MENKKEMSPVSINQINHVEAIKHLLQATDKSGIKPAFFGVYYDAEEKALVSSDTRRLFMFKGFDGSDYGMISGVYHVVKDKKSMMLVYQSDCNFPNYKQVIPSIEGKEVVKNIEVSSKKDYQVVDLSKALVNISKIIKVGFLNYDFLKSALIPHVSINAYVDANSLSAVHFVANEKVFGMDYEAIIMPNIFKQD